MVECIEKNLVENTMQSHEKGKILILKLYHKIFSILLCDNQIRDIQVENHFTDGLGSIYVGRVQNVSSNIGAVFVEIRKGELTFLPLTEVKDAVLLNRQADGSIKAGDELLVQLVKEPVKTKLAGISTKLSLSGSYVVVEYRKPSSVVLSDNTEEKHKQADHIRISAKLGAKYRHIYQELEPLKDIAKRFDIIIRTNAAHAGNPAEILAEAQSLAEQMEHILEVGDKRTCFSCLHQSEPAYLSFVKNSYRSEYDEIVTDEREIYDRLMESNEANNNIRYYDDSMLPLYKLYAIETRIRELLDKKVWLKSGAYLVIEQTEALIAIDVNTGKYETRKNQEETYLKINLEAAEAIATALRARNLSGMILVDFINMEKKEHVQQLIESMKSLLKKDSVPAYVVDITGLGLMEITRKKKNKSFAEQMKDVSIRTEGE